MVTIALLTLDIHIPHAQSLKDKRMVVRRLKDRLRSKFNVSVSETDHQELWQRATDQRGNRRIGRGIRCGRLCSLSLEESERSAPECIVQGNIEIV